MGGSCGGDGAPPAAKALRAPEAEAGRLLIEGSLSVSVEE